MPSAENVGTKLNIEDTHRQNIATFSAILTFFSYSGYILDGKGMNNNLTWVGVEDRFVQPSGQREGVAVGTLSALESTPVTRCPSGWTNLSSHHPCNIILIFKPTTTNYRCQVTY